MTTRTTIESASHVAAGVMVVVVVWVAVPAPVDQGSHPAPPPPPPPPVPPLAVGSGLSHTDSRDRRAVVTRGSPVPVLSLKTKDSSPGGYNLWLHSADCRAVSRGIL